MLSLQASVDDDKRPKGLEVRLADLPDCLLESLSDSSRNHVFADLQPYICTFEGCRDMLVTFHSRMAWFEHEYKHHWLNGGTKCILCSATLRDETHFSEHLERNHNVEPAYSTKLVRDLLVIKTKSKITRDSQCPLCQRAGWANEGKFIAHVSRHLEQIALSILPREVDSDNEQQDDSQLESGVSNTAPSPPADGSLSLSKDCDPPNEFTTAPPSSSAFLCPERDCSPTLENLLDPR